MALNPVNGNVNKTPERSSEKQVKSIQPDKVDIKKGVESIADVKGGERTELSQKTNAPLEPVEAEKVKQVVEKLERSPILSNLKISYEIDKRTDELVVKIVDKETGEMIRQIPPDELLDIAANLEETKGFILNNRG